MRVLVVWPQAACGLRRRGVVRHNGRRGGGGGVVCRDAPTDKQAAGADNGSSDVAGTTAGSASPTVEQNDGEVLGDIAADLGSLVRRFERASHALSHSQ
jgi:hypothetical protein